MSAGPTPPNPSAPKQNPHRPSTSILARYPGRLATAAVLGLGAYLYISRSPAPRDEPLVNLRSPGVQNIEKAYTNAGATPTHTKAYGGTTQGDKSSVYLREQGGTGAPANKGSPFDREGMGDEQRPKSSSTKAGEIFDHTNTGSTKG